MFKINEKHFTKETWWHKLKRWVFAQPILTITKDDSYLLAWHWKDGTYEIVEEGIFKPGGIVEVPIGCRVIQET